MINCNIRLSKCVFFFKSNNKILAYNNLNFKIVQIDNDNYVKLLTKDIDIDDELFNYLIENYFLVKKDFDEFKMREIIKKNIINKLLINPSKINYIRISLTENCNLRCKYCFVNKLIYNKRNMSEEKFVKAINYLIQNNKNVIVQYFGGEPLLRMDLIKLGHMMLLHSKSKNEIENFDEEIVTNGLLLTKTNMKFFIKNNIKLIFSLDGWKEINDLNRIDINGNGTYNEVMNNLLEFQKIGGMAEIIITPNSENINKLDKIVKYFVNKYHIKDISINAPQPTNIGWDLDGENFAKEIIKIYEFGEKKNLNLGLPGMNILNNLLNKRYEVFSCSNFGNASNRKWGMYLLSSGEISYCLVEKIKESSDIFEGFEINEKIDDWHIQKSDMKCSSCIAYSLCGGACSMERFLVSDLKILNNKCNFIKTILEWSIVR